MKQAVILAAGEGQRLRPFTVQRPKAMISIAHKPILQYAIEALAGNGIRDIVLVVGYHKEQVYDYFGSGERLKVNITYATQEGQLGTAHALAQVKDMVGDEFLVLYGDTLITADTIAGLARIKPETALIKRVDNPARYGVVNAADGVIKSIIEKPREASTNLVNIGVYAFSKEVFKFIGPELDIPDILNKMVVDGYRLNAVETEGTWLDVVYPWDILSLNYAILNRIQMNLGGIMERNVTLSGQVSVGKDTVLRSNCYIAGPAVIGSGCEIGPNVCILPATSIGDNVVISSFAEVKNSVIGNDVRIGAGSIIHNSVIGDGSTVKERFTACSGLVDLRVNGEYHAVEVGAMVGEGCSIENNVVAHPGVIAGNYCQVKAMKEIRGRFPDRSLVF